MKRVKTDADADYVAVSETDNCKGNYKDAAFGQLYCKLNEKIRNEIAEFTLKQTITDAALQARMVPNGSDSIHSQY